MPIQVGGITSGIDPNEVITAVINDASQLPIKNFANREAKALTKITGFGQLKSAMTIFRDTIRNNYQDENDFLLKTATSTDTDVFTATATGDAVNSSYQITVENIAEAHRISSKVFETTATEIGTGTLSITVGDAGSFDIAVNASNNTVERIRDAINDASDNKGVIASILNVDGGVQLMITSTTTGTASEITMATSDDDGNNTDDAGLSQLYFQDAVTGNMAEGQAAQDAEILVDGATVTNSTNIISSAIEGVTITLKKADVGNPHILSVGNNNGAVKTKIEQFVEDYNKLQAVIQELLVTNKEDKKFGLLSTNPLAISIENQVRRAITQQVAGIDAEFGNIFEMGVKTNEETRLLEIDESALVDAISQDFDAASKIFTSGTGVSETLESLLDNYVKFNGTLDNRTTTLNAELERINEQREALQTRLDEMEARLRRQLANLDQIIGGLNQTSTFLTQQFDMIGNIFKAKK